MTLVNFNWKTLRIRAMCLVMVAIPFVTNSQSYRQTGDDVPDFDVRPGYKVTMAVNNIENARFMAFDDNDILYVSRPDKEDVLALMDKNNDGRYETRRTFVEGYPNVHGLYYKDGWLWFTQTGGVHKGKDNDGDGVADEVQTVISGDQIPTSTDGHWWRNILVTDQHIYTYIGDPGNITEDTTTERKKVWQFDLNGNNKTLFASGIRNTEKLQLRPGTNEIWGADHNSDWFGRTLGENAANQPVTNMNPPGEFNHIKKGHYYGHPYFVGNMVPRIEYQDTENILEIAHRTTVPEWTFGSHWAPCGWTFISLDNNHLPREHRGDAYVAFHGSWNSSVKKGYRIQRILFDDVTGKPYGSLKIVGTLGEDGEEVLARPADCVEAPDGSLLFSSDLEGRIFRITTTN